MAIPLGEYQRHLQQAIGALDTLGQSDEGETDSARSARIAETLRAVRTVVPEGENVEWDGANFRVDNSWLHRELQNFEPAAGAERARSLTRIIERLQAIVQRLAEIHETRLITATKAEANMKLAEILRRPEYARKVEESAISRLFRDFWRWLQNLIPKPQPLPPGRANLFTKLAPLFVILLALAVIAYVMKLFAPRLFQKRRSRKSGKEEPRIVLGLRLKPDQTAADLLGEAEGLARRGELRAAIRLGYIALLVDLGERKIISLAQHKTNRDYLGAVREKNLLYENVKQLTDSFERHWYGFVSVTEADWLEFRTGYKQALSR